MESILINKHRLAGLKAKMWDDSLSSNIWGAELADGASDWESTEVTFRIRERYSNGNLNRITIFNNGLNLPLNKLDSPFLSFPVTKNEYASKQIGIRGSGTKLTVFRVGIFEYIASFDSDGKFYIANLKYCSDENGLHELDIEGEKFTKEKFQMEVKSIIVNVNLYDNFDDVPSYIQLKNDGRGLEYGIRWFSNSDIKFQEEKIKSWLSTRFSQVKNFKIYFEDITLSKPLRAIVPKTHLGIFNSDNQVIYDYTDLTKYNKDIEIKGVKFDLYYGCRISKHNDDLRYKKLQKSTKNQYQIRSLKSIRTESPLIVHLNSNDIIVCIDHLPPSEFTNETSWLIYFLKPKQNINDRYAGNKSNGYSDEEFGEELTAAIKQIIKDEKIKNNYHDASKKKEDGEVVQFIDYVCDSESTEIKKDFRSLTGVSKEIISNKKNWKTFKIDESGREIDARNESAGIWMEFQESSKNSDYIHCDGVAARINLTGRENSKYDTFIWVAKKHNHIDELKKMLKGYEWGNNHIKQIVFLTSEQIMDSFDVDEVPIINIERDILGL